RGARVSRSDVAAGGVMASSSLAQVEHALGLARAALDGLGWHDADVGGDADSLEDLPAHDGLQRSHGVSARLGNGGARLDTHFQRVQRAVAADHQEVVRLDATARWTRW